MKTKKTALVYIGALIIIVCFFLPWISISIMGFSFSVSGITFASGGGSSSLGFEANRAFYIVPLLAVILVFIAVLGRKKIGLKNTGVVLMISSAVLIIYGVYKVIQFNKKFIESMEGLSQSLGKMSIMNIIGIGFWGTFIGFGLIFIGGLMLFKARGETVKQPNSETTVLEQAEYEVSASAAVPTESKDEDKRTEDHSPAV